MLKRLFGLLLMMLALSGCAEPPYTNVDNEQLKVLIDQGVVVYDIRRVDEWQQTGVVTGSRKLTFVDANGKGSDKFLERFTAEVGKDTSVVLICRTGNRTDTLGRYLVEKLGYTQVYNVRDGIIRWISGGNPVSK
jgi:rhodanese-related sulfurtransferase